MKPYIWANGGRFYLSRGKNAWAILASRQFDTWQDAMNAAHSLIAHEPS